MDKRYDCSRCSIVQVILLEQEYSFYFIYRYITTSTDNESDTAAHKNSTGEKAT